MINCNLIIKKCGKSDKKAMIRFYKDHHYPISFMGYDNSYSLLFNEKTIGYAIVSYITANNPRGLLHALLIRNEQRNKGYSKHLIKMICDSHKDILCFADKGLKALYKEVGFKETTDVEIPACFTSKYESYKKKNTDLIILIKTK